MFSSIDILKKIAPPEAIYSSVLIDYIFWTFNRLKIPRTMSITRLFSALYRIEVHQLVDLHMNIVLF